MPIAGFEDRESHRTPFASAGRHNCSSHCIQLQVQAFRGLQGTRNNSFAES